MSAVIKINLTKELTKATIEGNGKECITLLVEFFYTNQEVKQLFKDALKVEQLYALQKEMETWKEIAQ